jgi:hypothetical protein
LAENSPPSGIYYRGQAPAEKVPAALDETASFVLDDEPMPGQVDSPSQISQGTASMMAETQETLAGVPATMRRPAPRPLPTPPAVAPAPTGGKFLLIAALVVFAAAAAFIAALMGVF